MLFERGKRRRQGVIGPKRRSTVVQDDPGRINIDIFDDEIAAYLEAFVPQRDERVGHQDTALKAAVLNSRIEAPAFHYPQQLKLL